MWPANFFYQAIVLVLSPLVGIAFLFSARGRIRIQERFGCNAVPKGDYARWWHAASVGELAGLLSLMKRDTRPSILTLTSTSALSVAVPENVVVRIAPFDCEIWYQLLFRNARFGMLVVTETELWPAMLSFTKRRGAPICWVNMRLRRASISWYRALRYLYAPLVRDANVFGSSKHDVARWVELFTDSPQVVLVGNSKFDRMPSVESDEEVRKISTALFAGPLAAPLMRYPRVLVLGSIHVSELELLLPGLIELATSFDDLRLIIAPRHREKDGAIAAMLERAGFDFVRRTGMVAPATQRAILLDTFGELERCYACAEIAFVGGSLLDLGGHNPLEASQYGCPVLMGPHTEVVEVIAAELRAAGALFTVTDSAEFVRQVSALLRDPNGLPSIGEQALAVAAQHRGASARLHVLLDRVEIAVANAKVAAAKRRV